MGNLQPESMVKRSSSVTRISATYIYLYILLLVHEITVKILNHKYLGEKMVYKMSFPFALDRTREADVDKAHPTGAYRTGGAEGGPGQW